MRDQSDNLSSTLVLTQQVAEELGEAARRPVETAGVLLASIVVTPEGDLRLLARGMRWVGEAAYLRRGVDHLSIASEGYVPFLGEAERMGGMAIWVHTHPGLDARPQPSRHDEEVDRQIADLFRLRSASSYYATLIISPRAEGLAFTGAVQREGQAAVPITRMWEVGDRFRLTHSFDYPAADVEAAFDRNVRAFGGAVQQALGNLRVGLVGCGGTGSAVAEQLVRLGVRRFVLIDPDNLSESNLTRVVRARQGRFAFATEPWIPGRSSGHVVV